ncbi:MAG TPA: DUF3501 family protein [Steroidobacteraceae bacterium]|nr:DUF3501 family protein [Steroidobacteraceae bacterium]
MQDETTMATHGKLTPGDLMSLERYARERSEFRLKVIGHKKNRTVAVGPHMTGCFEDRLTIQYQVQEMLRVERIFEPDGIEEELNAYNPLIPDGRNWKATLLIEYADPAERKQALAKMRGVEDRCWVEVEGCERVYAIADEDLERENEEKTSSVHFLRFELDERMREALGRGAALSIGVDHDAYSHAVSPLPDNVRSALLDDLA